MAIFSHLNHVYRLAIYWFPCPYSSLRIPHQSRCRSRSIKMPNSAMETSPLSMKVVGRRKVPIIVVCLDVAQCWTPLHRLLPMVFSSTATELSRWLLRRSPISPICTMICESKLRKKQRWAFSKVCEPIQQQRHGLFYCPAQLSWKGRPQYIGSNEQMADYVFIAMILHFWDLSLPFHNSKSITASSYQVEAMRLMPPGRPLWWTVL